MLHRRTKVKNRFQERRTQTTSIPKDFERAAKDLGLRVTDPQQSGKSCFAFVVGEDVPRTNVSMNGKDYEEHRANIRKALRMEPR